MAAFASGRALRLSLVWLECQVSLSAHDQASFDKAVPAFEERVQRRLSSSPPVENPGWLPGQSRPGHRDVLVNESGTYTVSGNKLTLLGQGGTQRKLDRDGRAINSRALPAWHRTYTYKMVDIEEAIHCPYLVLGGVEENGVDGGYDADFFPNAFVYVRGYHPEWRFQPF